MKLRPLFARVIVRAETITDKVKHFSALSRAGFSIPDTAKEKDVPTFGTVISCGPTADSSLKPGDRILFGKYAAKKIEGYDDLFIMQDEDILAVDEAARAKEAA